MKRLQLEAQIAGPNPLWITAALMAAIGVLCATAGDLVNISMLAFEVIFPFYTGICVAEWGKIRTDSAFETIAAQSKSVFRWIMGRFLCVFSTVGLFAVAGIAMCCFLRNEAEFGHLLWVYFVTALLFGSLSALGSLLSRIEHLAVALSGMVWLFFMAAQAMLEQVPSTRYYYPFLRLIAPDDQLWPINKALLLGISLACWALIYVICRIRRPLQD